MLIFFVLIRCFESNIIIKSHSTKSQTNST